MQIKTTTENLEYEFYPKSQRSYYQQKVVMQFGNWELELNYSGSLSWGAQWHSEYEDSSFLYAYFKIENIFHAGIRLDSEMFGFGSELCNFLDDCVHVVEDTKHANKGRLTFSFNFENEIENIIRELEFNLSQRT